MVFTFSLDFKCRKGDLVLYCDNYESALRVWGCHKKVDTVTGYVRT